MPKILENDAVRLVQGLDQMTDEQRAASLDIIKRYKQQQDDEGEPFWPSVERARVERENNLRSMFEAPDKITYDPGAFSPNPHEAKMEYANMALLSARYQKEPAEVASRYDFLLNDYARQKLGASADVDTAKFYALAQKDMQKVKLREDTQREGVSAALRGEDGVKALAAWQAKNADRAKDDAGLFMRGYQQALEQDGEMLPIADRLLKALESGTDKTGQNVQANMERGQVRQELGQMVEQLAGMKKAQRKSVYRSIAARIQAAGYDQKGFWSQMLGFLDQQLYRAETTLSETSGIASDVASNFPAMLAEGMTGNRDFGITPSETAQTDASVARRKSIGNVQQEIMQIVSGELDPVKPVTGWMNETIETGLIKGPGAVAPFMAASALLGPYGAGVVFTADFAAQNRRELVQSGLDDEQAQKIAVMAAPLQAAVESLSNMVSLGKFPAVQAALPRFTRPVGGASLVGRYVQNSLISGATEFTEEQIQDNLVVPAMQELLGALEKDVPEVDWSFYKTRAANASPELAATLLPMALVFGGVMTAADAKLSRTMTQNVELMMSTGMDQAQAVDVASQPTQEQRIRRGAELWNQRKGTKASMEEAQKKLADQYRTLAADSAAAVKELEARGVLPRLLPMQGGEYRLTFNDGSTADFKTREEALGGIHVYIRDRMQRSTRALRETIDTLTKNLEQGREFALEISPEAMPADEAVKRGIISPQALQERAEQGAILDATTLIENSVLTGKALGDEEAPLMLFGMSKNEWYDKEGRAIGMQRIKDDILRTTMRLWDGASPLTLIEEKTEGDAKVILSTPGKRQWMLDHLRAYEDASGDKLFTSDDNEQINDKQLIEAWSHMAQSYFVAAKDKVKGRTLGRYLRDIEEAELTAAMQGRASWWQAVVNRAQKLGELKAAGKLNEDVVAELEKQLGIDSQVKHEQEAMQEAQNVANEVAQQVDTSGYSPETPGPNGETFSIIQLSDAFQQAGKFYRIVHGEAAFRDLIESGKVRTNAASKVSVGASLMDRLRERPTAFPSFSKDYAAMHYAGSDANHFIIVTDDASLRPSTNGRHSKGKTYFPTNEKGEHLTSLPAQAVDVFRHIGNGMYQLVYSRGKLISNKATQVPNGETFSIGRVKNGGRLLTFEKPIETPLGRVVSYEWQSDVIEDVDKNGEAVLKRVSDWDKAVANAETGRAIVHHFTVIQPDGSEKIVSLESALKATKGTETGKALNAAVKAARRLPLREAELIELEKLQADYDAAINEANSQGWRNAPEPELRTPEFPPLAERGVKAVYVGGQFIKNLEPNELGSFGYKPSETEWKKQWAVGQLQRPPYGTGDRIQTLRRLIKKDKALIDSASLFSSRAIPADASKVVQMPDGARLVGPTTFSIRVFHGTPHKVDKFTTGKIGTGEGAQAYGWGLYFAENAEVAKQYKTILSARDNNLLLDGSPIAKKTTDEERELASDKAVAQAFYAPLLAGKTPEEAKVFLLSMRKDKTWVDALTQFDTSRLSFEKDNTGNLYTVELLPDEDQFLDWDKPLSGQSEKVKAAIQPFTKNLGDDIFPTGGALYSQFIAEPRGEQKASEKLASLGIPGIRYLDSGSRGAGNGTRNYVIFDENLVRILEENGKPVAQETFSLRVTPAQDAEYMAAVEAGDMEKAQRMVDEAANDAADTLEQHNALVEAAYLNAIRHGNLVEAKRMVDAASLMSNGFTATRRDDFTVARLNKAQLREVMEIASNQTSLIVTPAALYEDSEPIILARNGKPDSLRDGFWRVAQMVKGGYDGNIPVIEMTGPEALEFSDSIDDSGIDVRQEYVTVYDAAKVAIADPSGGVLTLEQRFPYASLSDIQLPTVLRDDAGNVIPLSQRFNPADDRITYSLRPGDFASRVEAMFSPFQRSPEARLIMTRIAKSRALKLGQQVFEASIRTIGSIDREARVRAALAEDKAVQDYLDGLTPAARQTLEWQPADLQDDPLIAAMLDFGKLMSKTTALQRGKVDLKMGDFDGAPWLPPSFYSKGAGIMPDQMAQAMFDAGLLPDAYTDTLWAELSKRIEATRKDKAAHREAVQAFKDAKKAARDAAAKEAGTWADNAKKQAGSAKAQRERIKAWLRVLDGILAASPPEVRARVGGFVKMAGIATDEAALRYLEDRVAKLDKELEKWLKKDATGSINRLFKKAAADYTAGKKAKGKLGPDEHYLFQRAEAASEMDAAALRGELAKLDALADDESLSDDQRALAVLERGIVELVGDMKNADSGRLFTAFDELTRLYSQGVVAWKAKQTARREARQAVRDALKADAGKSGVLKERQAMEKAMTTLFGKAKSAWLSVSSFSEVLRYAFGSKSQQATELIDGEREASNAYEDEQQAIADELEAFFTSMAGGKVLDGERLRFDMAQRTIKAGDVELSQFEAITALLMWRQEDGRRHMEGTFDEDGKRTSGWSYDQAWIDEVEKQLTPEGRRVMAWLAAKYGSEHGELNALYRERHGVNLPAHDNYAPLTVKPMTAKAGEMVDPVSGAAVSGSILTPGSLRTRSRMAIAEPEFRDALQTFVAHKKQMGYWKAYYDLATDMQAVLGNRELMNSVEAAAGKEAVVTLRKWMDVLAQGGVRDAAAGLAMNSMFQRMMSRAATVGLLGRVSTLLVQSTQLAAASVQMPVGAYLRRFGKLLAGQLDWKGALQSDFIQRRIQTAPPIVRQAMENLGTATRPNLITRAVRNLGNLLSGADGLFTGGTYAILLDYHRETGRKLGLTGADLEEHAHREAERATEEVAQPTRTATRSLAELTATNPLAKVSFAYASEARQKIALLGWSLANFKADPVRFGKAAFLVFGVGGVMSQVLKNIWKEAKGDDDEEKWSPERLIKGSFVNALHGIPMMAEIMGEPGMFSSTAWAQAALDDLLKGEADLRDINTLLGTLGLFNDTAAGIAAMSNAGYDFAKIIEAAFSE